MKANFIMQRAESVEHYTPRYIWERVARVMDGIDIDPAAESHNLLCARVYFTRETNGLDKPWCGTVYLNPPFGDVRDWFRKLALEFEEHHTPEAIVLWKGAMETVAMRILMAIPEYRLSAVPRTRVSYPSGEKKRGSGDSSTFTTMLHYFGPHAERFSDIFYEIADIWECKRSMSRTQEKL